MTKQQKNSANPAHSVWVSANAGSGKTSVLTQRVLRLLLQGVPPHRILCLTYTNAAAAEMSLRIQRMLSLWVTAEDNDLRLLLQEMLEETPQSQTIIRARRLFALVVDAPEGIRIQTIHSLCQSLLRRFALEAGVSPHFRLMDEHETKALLQESKEHLLLSHLRGEDGALLVAQIREVTAVVSETIFNSILQELITERSKIEGIIAKGISHFQQRLVEFLGVDYLSETQESLIAKHFRYIDSEVDNLRSLLPTMQQSKSKRDTELAESLSIWLCIQGEITAEDVERWLPAMLTSKNAPKVYRDSFLITKQVTDKFPEAREWLGQEVERAYAYWKEYAAYSNARLSEAVWHMAQALLEIYRNLKRQRGLLDYEDLIQQASRLLSRPDIAPWVLFKLDGGIDHLLVDEAQDTSRVQWQLIEAIATEFFVGKSAAKEHRTLFVVGDEKQSIYSFQGAEPTAFAEMKQFFARQAQSAEKPFLQENLLLSFRSTPAILRAVDAVFASPEVRKGVIFSESGVEHLAHRNAPGKVELWPLCAAEKMAEREAWKIPDTQVMQEIPQRQLAEKIADVIGGWLREGRILPARGRPVRPSDIMILVRRRNRFFNFLISALKKRNIPLAGADRLRLSEHIAVMDMQALAQFLLLPEDDLNLACLLKSPLFGISEADLFALCYGRKSSLWEMLRKSPHNTVTQRLEDWLNAVDYLRPYEIFARVLEAEGGRRRFITRLGEEVNDPLNEFLSLAMEYERLHSPSLQGFLHWFKQTEVEIKRDLEQSRDEVRILTVHGAKGLEAPIVFLPDTTDTPDMRERLYFTPDNSLFLFSHAAQETSALLDTLKAEAERKDAEEYRRLLYVAMTRAADELYIGGWLEKKRKDVPAECWYQIVKAGLRGIATVQTEANKDGEVLETLVVEDRVDMLTQNPLHPQREGVGDDVANFPHWLHRPAPEEPVPSRPLAPSKPEGEEPVADSPMPSKDVFERGKIIHSLLEVLPEILPERREQAGKLLLRRENPEISQEEVDRLLQEVMAVLHHPQFAPVFGVGSRAEVPLTATVIRNGKTRILSGQIDRLVVTPQEVLILDYKSNRRIPESEATVPEYYRHQLAGYAEAIAQIYPDKMIKTAILWTSAPLLMPVDERLANAYMKQI